MTIRKMVPQRRAVQTGGYCNRDGRPVPYAAYGKPGPLKEDSVPPHPPAQPVPLPLRGRPPSPPRLRRVTSPRGGGKNRVCSVERRPPPEGEAREGGAAEGDSASRKLLQPGDS